MLNKVILIGRLGRDPEIKESYCRFSIATSEKYFSKKENKKIETTEWHNCVAFGQLAKICSDYLKKGKIVYLEGKIKRDEYVNKDNVKTSSTSIIVESLKFMGTETKETEKQDEKVSPSPSDPFADLKTEYGDDIPF